ncbi:hypothetical protein Hanom_Chr06g00572851 [Helianthus anomalus]
MNRLKDRVAAFICEKEVREVDFKPFNVIYRFKTLGWEEIQEWMATGTVNNIDVEMSFESVRRLAKFDSRPEREYMFLSLDDLYHKPAAHPRWNSMLEAMFLLGTWHGTLYWSYLKIKAKLLLVICVCNVIPRRGDKMEVRYLEVPILYTLLHGAPLFQFCFLVLNNIWISRNSVGRRIIPHCRLIMELLKMYGAIGSEDMGVLKRHKPFDLKKLGTGWKYQESERYHKLKSEG